MALKKKYHGGLILFSLVLLELLFINCSMANTIYDDDMEYNQADYIFNWFLTTTRSGDVIASTEIRPTFCYQNGGSTTSGNPQLKSSLSNLNTQTLKENFVTQFNLTSHIKPSQYFFIATMNTVSYNSGLKIFAFPSNNEIGNEEDFWRIFNIHWGSNSNSYIVVNKYSNDSTTPVLCFTITTNGVTVDTVSYTNYYFYNKALSNIFTQETNTNAYYSQFNICTLYPTRFYGSATINASCGNGIFDNSNINTPYIMQGYYEFENPIPDNPSSDNTLGNITTPSGDNGGNINLQPIKDSLNNIQNQISGDTTRIIDNQNQNTNKIIGVLEDSGEAIIDNTNITSGDIYNALNITPVTNPYQNLWLTLLNGFSDALTGVNRTLTIEFRGETYIINLDDFTGFIPLELRLFLGIISTVYVCLLISKWTKLIIDDVSTASIDNVANKLTEDFVTNMF